MIKAEEARIQAEEYENGIFYAKEALKIIEEKIRSNSRYGEHRTVHYYHPNDVDKVDVIVDELRLNGYDVKCFEHENLEGKNYQIIIRW